MGSAHSKPRQVVDRAGAAGSSSSSSVTTTSASSSSTSARPGRGISQTVAAAPGASASYSTDSGSTSVQCEDGHAASFSSPSLARLDKNDRSLLEELGLGIEAKSNRFDGGGFEPHGIYAADAQDWDRAMVRRLICSRRLAPFYEGSADPEEDEEDIPKEDVDHSTTTTTTTTTTTAATTAVSTPNASNVVSVSPNCTTAPTAAATTQATTTKTATASPATTATAIGNITSVAVSMGSPLRNVTSADSNSTGSVSKTSQTPADKTRALVVSLLKRVIECPVCFLCYPRNINHSRCCHQPICTECFVQFKRHDALLTPTACPFCMQPNFGIVYTPPSLFQQLSSAASASANERRSTTPVAGGSGGGGSRSNGLARPLLSKLSFSSGLSSIARRNRASRGASISTGSDLLQVPAADGLLSRSGALAPMRSAANLTSFSSGNSNNGSTTNIASVMSSSTPGNISPQPRLSNDSTSSSAYSSGAATNGGSNADAGSTSVAMSEPTPAAASVSSPGATSSTTHVRTRSTSFSHTHPDVVTCDDIRPEVTRRLQQDHERATSLARHAALLTSMSSQNSNRSGGSGSGSGRSRILAVPLFMGRGSNTSNGNNSISSSGRNRRRTEGSGGNASRHIPAAEYGGVLAALRMESDIEDVMLMEAMRLSVIDEEDRQRRVAQEEFAERQRQRANSQLQTQQQQQQQQQSPPPSSPRSPLAVDTHSNGADDDGLPRELVHSPEMLDVPPLQP